MHLVEEWRPTSCGMRDRSVYSIIVGLKFNVIVTDLIAGLLLSSFIISHWVAECMGVRIMWSFGMGRSEKTHIASIVFTLTMVVLVGGRCCSSCYGGTNERSHL